MEAIEGLVCDVEESTKMLTSSSSFASLQQQQQVVQTASLDSLMIKLLSLPSIIPSSIHLTPQQLAKLDHLGVRLWNCAVKGKTSIPYSSAELNLFFAQSLYFFISLFFLF